LPFPVFSIIAMIPALWHARFWSRVKGVHTRNRTASFKAVSDGVARDGQAAGWRGAIIVPRFGTDLCCELRIALWSDQTAHHARGRRTGTPSLNIHQPAEKANMLSSIDMKKTAENTKIANKKVANPHQMKGVMSAVTAVVGEEPDTFADVDEHPGSLDLPTQKTKPQSCLPK
jgi:hypothetical protein